MRFALFLNLAHRRRAARTNCVRPSMAHANGPKADLFATARRNSGGLCFAEQSHRGLNSHGLSVKSTPAIFGKRNTPFSARRN